MLKNVKGFINDLVKLNKLYCEFNEAVNNEIKAAKKKIKEQENESKVLFFEYKQED